MLDSHVQINRFKVTPESTQVEKDPICVEEPLQISLSQGDKNEVFSLTMRTPGNDNELAVGLLFSEGVIKNREDIQQITISKVDDVEEHNLLNVCLAEKVTLDLSQYQRHHMSYSGCGLCGKTSLQALELKQSRPFKSLSIKFDNQLIYQLKSLLAKQPLFSQTGGVHAAGLVYQENDGIDFAGSPFFEDVGRHNALDKLIGYELIKNDLTKAGILVLSGRIGFELVQKAIMAGFSVIVALGAPSQLAVQAANRFNVTLIGFAKDKSFNLYTAHSDMLV